MPGERTHAEMLRRGARHQDAINKAWQLKMVYALKERLAGQA